MRRSIVRTVAPLLPLLLAPAAAVAQDPYDAPLGPAPSAIPSAKASAAPAPSNAPILLSPGVAPTTPKPASAVAPAAPAEGRTAPPVWFGWQTLAVDLAILGGTAGALFAVEEKYHLPIFIGGSALFLSASPLIHLAHGSGRAGRSFLFRAASVAIGVPVGVLLFAGIAGCSEVTPCKLEPVDFAALGTGGGALLATIIDGGMFAWKAGTNGRAFVSPNVARVRGGAIVGVNVVF